MKPPKSEKRFALIIILILVFIGGIGAYFIFKNATPKTASAPSTTSSVNVSANTNSLFGIMIAFGVKNFSVNGDNKGWTEFKKDNSAYQNFLSGLKKTIQNNTKLVKATGFSLNRELVPYFTWNVVEPQKGQFDWGLTDIYAQVVSNVGVKISAVIQPFTGWDQKNTSPLTNCKALDFAYYDYKAGPPNDFIEYENFLMKTVERYKDKVAVWEIGNEYDGQCGGYKNNPDGYFDLVKITSETIKKAYPNAKVTNGGAGAIVGDTHGMDFKAFWTKFFALGGGQYIDYFNIHYNTERSSDVKLDPTAFEKDLAAFNDLMDKNGGRKPLYLTEFGIYSGSPSSQQGGQPAQGTGQAQTNLPTQPTSFGQSSNQPMLSGRCGDGICDDVEKQNPDRCPQDCGGSMPGGNSGQSSGQSTRGQTTGQNIQPNQGQTLHNLSENDQAVLYFKYSVLAFANGAKVIFIDLIGDDSLIGSSMAFNIDGVPRPFLTTLKTIDNKIGGFSKAEKIADGQYKFTVGGRTIYALWSGALPNEISGSVKVTDIKGQEQTVDVTVVKLSADQPVFLELQK